MLKLKYKRSGKCEPERAPPLIRNQSNIQINDGKQPSEELVSLSVAGIPLNVLYLTAVCIEGLHRYFINVILLWGGDSVGGFKERGP